MKALSKVRRKVSSFVGSPFQKSLTSGVSRYGKTAIILLMFMVFSVFAQGNDASTMTAGIDTEISGAKSILYGLAGTVIGVAVVFVIYRFVRKMIG